MRDQKRGWDTKINYNLKIKRSILNDKMDYLKHIKSGALAASLEPHQLPILNDNKLDKLINNNDCSLNQCIARIQHNPTLYFNLIIKVNKQNAARGVCCETGDHATTLMGLNTLQEEIAKQSKVDNGTGSAIFLQLTTEANLAGELVESLIKQGHVHGRDLKSMALLWNIPYVILANFNAEQYRLMDNCRYFFPLTHYRFMTKSLNCPLPEALTQAHNSDYLPSSLKSGLEKILSFEPITLARKLIKCSKDNDSQERQWLQEDATKAMLISMLSRSVFQPYYRSRCTRLIKLFATAFHIPTEKALKALNSAILRLSQPIKDGPNPAFYHLLLRSKAPFSFPFSTANNSNETTRVEAEHSPSAQNAAPNKARAVTDESKDAPEYNPGFIIASSTTRDTSVTSKNQCNPPQEAKRKRPPHNRSKILTAAQDIRKTPALYGSFNSTIIKCLEISKSTFHFDRVVFIIISPDQKKCMAKVALGCDSFPELAQFKLDLSQFPIFNKFLASSVFLSFGKEKHNKHWNKLPAFLANDDKLNGFLLSSFSSGQKINMFFYADNRDQGWGFDHSLLLDYRQYLKCVVESLQVQQRRLKSSSRKKQLEKEHL